MADGDLCFLSIAVASAPGSAGGPRLGGDVTGRGPSDGVRQRVRQGQTEADREAMAARGGT